MTWSQWQSIRIPTECSSAAVYQVRGVVEGRAVEIPRFLAVEPHGILVIGCTNDMSRRRKDFVKGLDRCYGHSEGNLLHLLARHSDLASRHPSIDYEFRHAPQSTKEAAERTEALLVKAYIRRYGEGPPLNAAIPDRYDEEGWAGEAWSL